MIDLRSQLQKRFGYTEFRAGQEGVIQDVLERKDTLAIFPTGMGKSLCYQLPAYFMKGAVLIISPLVALMEDQVAIMKKNGEKRVVALNSFLTFSERARILAQLHQYKFIFVSPEMLTQEKSRTLLGTIDISLLVVDEAHCISQWGFDFRPDYLRLGEFIKSIKRPGILALTATADEKVIGDISHYLELIDPVIHRQSIDRPNISYSIVQVGVQTAKTKWIKERLLTTEGPGIIYVASRKRAEELAAFLRQHEIAVAAYHAGMEQEDRAFIQDQFITGELTWICATNAFGMGIHKDDIRQIIHDHIPQSTAGYSQEVGRAGRDQQRAAATLLYSPDDVGKMRFITQEEVPHEFEIRQYEKFLAQGLKSEEAAEKSSLSETGKRVIDYYMENMAVESIIVRMDELRREKEYQLQKMLGLIHSNSCIRQELLASFGESLETRPAVCCSACGIDDEKWLRRTKDHPTVRKDINWQDRLAELLG